MQETQLERESGESISVSHVVLESFRNYDRLNLDLSDRFNVLAGRNGQGKTNFLEALYLLATTRLLRGQKDIEAVRDGAEKAMVQAELHPMGTRIGMSIERGAR
jgi:DNA replication and repair protein RecF